MSFMSCCLKRRGKRRPIQPFLKLSQNDRVIRRVCLYVGVVNNLRFPIEIASGEPAAPPDHTHHLGESAVGIRDMHQHPFGPASVKACVRETQGLRIADLEFHSKTLRSRPFSRRIYPPVPGSVNEAVSA